MHCVISWILLASTFSHWLFLCSTELLYIFLTGYIFNCLSPFSSLSHIFCIQIQENINFVLKIVLEWVELAMKSIYICYADKSFFMWERKQDSWSLVTTVSSFSIWALQDIINWSIYSLYSILTYWEDGKENQGCKILDCQITALQFLPKLSAILAILLSHSKWTLHHTKKFRFYHHLLIYGDMWSAVALVAMIYGHIFWFPVELQNTV